MFIRLVRRWAGKGHAASSRERKRSTPLPGQPRRTRQSTAGGYPGPRSRHVNACNQELIAWFSSAKAGRMVTRRAIRAGSGSPAVISMPSCRRTASACWTSSAETGHLRRPRAEEGTVADARLAHLVGNKSCGALEDNGPRRHGSCTTAAHALCALRTRCVHQRTPRVPRPSSATVAPSGFDRLPRWRDAPDATAEMTASTAFVTHPRATVRPPNSQGRPA